MCECNNKLPPKDVLKKNKHFEKTFLYSSCSALVTKKFKKSTSEGTPFSWNHSPKSFNFTKQ